MVGNELGVLVAVIIAGFLKYWPNWLMAAIAVVITEKYGRPFFTLIACVILLIILDLLLWRVHYLIFVAFQLPVFVGMFLFLKLAYQSVKFVRTCFHAPNR